MKKRVLFIIVLAIVMIGELFIVNSLAIKENSVAEYSDGNVIVDKLNLRCGPGTEFNIVGKLYENDYISILAKIEDWYVVQTENDVVGCVKAEYIKGGENKVVTLSQVEESDLNENEITSSLTVDELEVLNLINAERKLNGLNELQIDDDLQNVARIKAQDMITNDYFAHQSETYGSPFDMMKANQISYKVAGENIAGNSDNKRAVEAWLNSESHKKNILNNAFNYTGIAVVDSAKYGKIFVQMFIGR